MLLASAEVSSSSVAASASATGVVRGVLVREERGSFSAGPKKDQHCNKDIIEQCLDIIAECDTMGRLNEGTLE